MRLLTALTLSLLLISCKNKVRYSTDGIPEKEILLNRWYVLGPFPSEGRKGFLEIDNLTQFGTDEKTITFDEFIDIKPSSQTIAKNQLSISDNYKNDFNKLFNLTDSTTLGGNVYAACLIEADKDQTLKLNFSSDDGAKVWLNNILIHHVDRIGEIKYYDNYIDLNLKKGSNFLLVKVNNVEYGWEMYTVLEKESKEGLSRHKKTFLLDFGFSFLQRSVISNNQLSINGDMPSKKQILTVKKLNDEVIFTDSSTSTNSTRSGWDIDHLSDGLYTTTLRIKDDTFNQNFYKGDIAKAIQNIINDINQFKSEPVAKRNTEILVYRFNHLLKPNSLGNSDTEKRDWDRKMIYLYTRLLEIRKMLSKGQNPDGNATGGLIKSFISKIDGGEQYYQIFVPHSYKKGKPLPVVIEIPKMMNWHPSPLETYRFANIKLFELFQSLADKYNMIVVDPCFRMVDQVNMNTIDETDLWETLEDVKRNYDLDTSRYYLRGACLASRDALKLAAKNPDKFAAISIVAPQPIHSTINNPWIQQNEPLNYLQNIKYIPLLNIHSTLDPHSPIILSHKLNKEFKKIGLINYTYRELPTEFKMYYSEEYLDDIFKFFSQHSLRTKPKEILFSTTQLKYNKSFWITLDEIKPTEKASIECAINDNVLTIHKANVNRYTIDLRSLPYDKKKKLTILDNEKKIYDAIPKGPSLSINPLQGKSKTKNSSIEGPFAHIFTQPFILVPGTSGSTEETARIMTLTDTINKYWVRRYFSKCKVVSDRDITDHDAQTNNLLLIGTPKSNTIFQRIEKDLPLKITGESISISTYNQVGRSLGYYFIHPNPLNEKKYVGIIGYNNPLHVSLGFEEKEVGRFNDISNYGWYDFKIWNATTSDSLAVGYFDFNWKNSN